MLVSPHLPGLTSLACLVRPVLPWLRRAANLGAVALALLCLTAVSGRAQTTWTGNSSANWNTNVNWDSATIPDSATDVIVNTGNGSQPLLQTGNIGTANTLTIGLDPNSTASTSVTVAGGQSLNVTVLDVAASELSFGALTVVGNSSANSTLNVASTLTLGDNGVGNLGITAGGQVVSGFTYLANGANATGFVTLSGANSTWTVLGQFFVGSLGFGNLSVTGGALLSSINTDLAENVGSVGNVIISGNNSRWLNAGQLLIGNSGNATLTINNGGNVTGGSGASQIGEQEGSNGTVNLSGSTSRWNTHGVLYVGSGGAGTLNVSSGANVTSTQAYVSAAANATGTVFLTDNGTTWTSTGSVAVGFLGPANFTVTSGALATTPNVTLGQFAGGAGSVLVASNATWNCNGALVVGSTGSANLTIGDGGKMFDANATVGFGANATGIVRVVGAGGNWSHTGNLTLGVDGVAKLTISTGAQVVVGGLTQLARNADAATTLSLQAGGLLQANGGLQTKNSSQFIFQLDGPARVTQYGAVNVAGGNCTLAGNLTVTLGNNFAPAAGDEFNLFQVTGGFILGGFTSVTLPVLSPGLAWDSSNLTTNGTIAVQYATKPVFESQPISHTVKAGSTVSFSVTAAGEPPLKYQWRLNGKAIAGATSATLTLKGVKGSNSGSYTVVVSGPKGSETSLSATLTVVTTAPKITTQPKAVLVTKGKNASFKVKATGDAPLAYAWQKGNKNLKNGGEISGATTATLKITAAKAGDAGSYRVIVTNLAGKATSSVAKLTVH